MIAGIKHDGRYHLSPNFFFWDGQRFFISTTRVLSTPSYRPTIPLRLSTSH